MSDMPKEDQQSLNKLGSVLLESLSKDALRTLSLAHDCGYLDIIMDKEVNPQVAIDFPEEFADPDPDNDIACARLQDETWVGKAMDEMIAIAPTLEEEGGDPYLAGIMGEEVKDSPVPKEGKLKVKGQTEGYLDIIRGEES